MAQRQAGGGNVVLVDLGETAVVTGLNEAGAEITDLAGRAIQASWTPGKVLFSWENGFAIATARESVRFSSSDTEYTIEDHGVLGGSDGARR